jgi:hypothetical protein
MDTVVVSTIGDITNNVVLIVSSIMAIISTIGAMIAKRKGNKDEK